MKPASVLLVVMAALTALSVCAVAIAGDGTTAPGTANPDYAEVEPLTLGPIEILTEQPRSGRPVDVRVDVSAPSTLTVRVARLTGRATRQATVLVVHREAGLNALRLPADAIARGGRHRIASLAESDSGQTATVAKRLIVRG
jgi:hypothetical protein